MKAELVSLQKGDAEGIYNAVLKIIDDTVRDEDTLRKALERSINSLNVMEGIRVNAQEIGSKMERLYAASLAREQVLFQRTA